MSMSWGCCHKVSQTEGLRTTGVDSQFFQGVLGQDPSSHLPASGGASVPSLTAASLQSVSPSICTDPSCMGPSSLLSLIRKLVIGFRGNPR